MEYPRPSLTVDLVILTILDADLKILLVRRGEPPFEGRLALPGGFVRVGPSAQDPGEDLEAAAHRELAEETGLPHGSAWLAQLHTFGAPARDPRGRVVTVCYYALVRSSLAPLVNAGGDAADARWHSVAELDTTELAFDHAQMVDLALTRLRDAIEHEPIAFELCPETFSIAELRGVYQTIRREPYDPGNFRRRFLRMVEQGLIEPAPGRRITGRRPATVYRFAGPTRRAPTGRHTA